jgi:sugar phosphate isomerase/epimerase
VAFGIFARVRRQVSLLAVMFERRVREPDTPATTDVTSPGEMMRTARYAVNGWSMPSSPILEDIAAVKRTGADGLGLLESKIGAGEDQRVLESMHEHSISASFCVPATGWVLPVPSKVPGTTQDPEERIELMCEGVARLAKFDPAVIVIGPGVTGVPNERAGPVEVVADGLGRVADVAAEHGLRIGFELLAQRRGATHHSIAEAVHFLDEVGRENVGVMWDIWHSWSEPGVHESLRAYGHRINSVHINDVRPIERCAYDRLLPGEGRRVAPDLIATLIEVGYDGLYELEVMSDDGRFGTNLPDSLWRLPLDELLSQAKAAFDEVWAEANTIVERR